MVSVVGSERVVSVVGGAGVVQVVVVSGGGMDASGQCFL